MGPLRIDGAALHVIQPPKLEHRIMRYQLGDFEWAAVTPMLSTSRVACRVLDSHSPSPLSNGKREHTVVAETTSTKMTKL